MFRLALNLNVPTNEYSSVLDVLGYLREYTYLSDNILPLIQQFQHRWQLRYIHAGINAKVFTKFQQNIVIINRERARMR